MPKGSYNYMMRGSTSFPNLFVAGDWIINRHGSWSQVENWNSLKSCLSMFWCFLYWYFWSIYKCDSLLYYIYMYCWQEKAFVTGLEAANRVVDYLGDGMFAKILPVEEDEPQIQALRSLNRNLNEIRAQLPWSNYFLEWGWSCSVIGGTQIYSSKLLTFFTLQLFYFFDLVEC